MSDNLKDILSHLSTDIDQEILLRYLKGKLTPGEQHEVEKQLQENHFEADAVEGLQQVKDEAQLQYLLDQLHRDLKKKTAKKKALREKLRFKEQPVLWIALLLLLLLIVISYFIVHRLHFG